MTVGVRSYRKYQEDRALVENTVYGPYGSCTAPPSITVTLDDTLYSRDLRLDSVTWTGNDTPDYRDRIKQGINSVNTYNKTWKNHTVTPASGTVYYVNRINACGGYQPELIKKVRWRREVNADLSGAGPPAFDALVNTTAAQQFIRRSRAAISEAQALVSVGEVRESVRMVLSARRAVLNKLIAFQKSAVKSTRGMKVVKDRHKAVANAWLEYSFGWGPLVGDSVNFANAAAATISGSVRNRRVSSRSARVVSTTETPAIYDWGTTAWVGTSARKRNTILASCAYFGALRWETGQAGDYKSSFGLTMDNWIPSIWELIPWSFAIDYFTGIGDFLSSITFPLGKFLYYGRSRKSEEIAELFDMKLTSAPVETLTQTRQYYATPGKTRVREGRFQRDVPSLIVRVPRLRVPGYKEAYINLSSLATLRKHNRI